MRELFSSDEFSHLKDHGAHVQRVLWASTGTKKPEYSDIKYVEELIVNPTVNTVPEATLQAFLDHGEPQVAALISHAEASAVVDQLQANGIDTC